jgi:hypothetical protein
MPKAASLAPHLQLQSPAVLAPAPALQRCRRHRAVKAVSQSGESSAVRESSALGCVWCRAVVAAPAAACCPAYLSKQLVIVVLRCCSYHRQCTEHRACKMRAGDSKQQAAAVAASVSASRAHRRQHVLWLPCMS